MIRQLIPQFIRGFAMGAADIVPGVSGGTVALIFGIYTELLRSVKSGAHALGSLLKGDLNGFKEHFSEINWLFLVPLGLGVLTALAALSSLIEGALADYPEEMAGLFMGLVLASIVIAWGLLKAPNSQHIAIVAVVGVIVFLLLGFQNGPLSEPSLPVYFGAGAIAICAMILPGISGSFLLLMMGMYAAVLGAAHDRAIVELAVFAAGAAVGLGLFSSFLHRILDKHHDLLMAVLVGLMAGSMRVLWPWPNGVGIISEEETEAVSGTALDLPAGDEFLMPVVLAVLAFVFVVVVSKLGPQTVEETKLPEHAA